MVTYPRDFVGPLRPEDVRSYVPTSIQEKFHPTLEEKGTLSGGKKKITFSGGGGYVSPPLSGASAAQIAEQKRLKAIADRLAREKAERARVAREKLAATRTQQALREKTIESRRQLEIDKTRARERERRADEQRRIDKDISRIRTTSTGGVSVTKPGEG